MKSRVDTTNCCGCESCRQVCPKKAISILVDENGFYRASIDDSLCIDCGICKKHCPLQSAFLIDFLKSEEALAAVHKNPYTAEKSSSGGAWTAIAQVFCDENYAIFGASWNEDFTVRHEYVENVEKISKFRKSKYLPSRLNDTFSEVKTFLEGGKKVLFSGTPCQVAGLKIFLKKDYENLLLIDFSCHGFGAPKMFNRYISEVEEKAGEKVVGYDFRHKARHLMVYSSTSSKIDFKSGKSIVRFLDPWFRGFVRAFYKNSCCFKCPYAGLNRISDITLGDFWWVERFSKNFDAGKGVSLILANTPKGKAIAQKLNSIMKLESLPLETCAQANMPLKHPVERNPQQEKFDELIKTHTLEETIKILEPKYHLILRTQFALLKFVPSRYRWKVDNFLRDFKAKIKQGVKKFL